MNNAQEVAKTIKNELQKQGKSVSDMLEFCQLSKNTLSSMSTRGSWIASDSLAKIADYLDVSVDDLLGREKGIAPDDKIRSDLIAKVKGLSVPQAQRLLDLLEAMGAE
jgi:transcriptional regulator with XRE-family HTH domain